MNSVDPEAATSRDRPAGCLLWTVRLFLVVIALGHVAAALGWAWISPGGFPAGHARTVGNLWLPLALAAASGAALLGVLPGKERWAVGGWCLWTATWFGGAVGALVLYPGSAVRLVLACVVPCGCLALSSVAVVAAVRRRAGWGVLAVPFALVGLAAGAGFPWTQRAPPPSTIPSTGEPPALTEDTKPHPGDRVEIDRRAKLREDGTVYVQVSEPKSAWMEHALRVRAIPEFRSRAPDGGWVLFAPGRYLRAPPLRDAVFAHVPRYTVFHAQDFAEHRLQVRTHDERRVEIDAWSTFPDDVHTHLNTWLHVWVGHTSLLKIRFSPCPSTPFEFRASNRFLGPGAVFGAMFPDGTFRVLQAKHGLKGPYRELARGPLNRGDPLAITLEREGEPWARLHLLDFSSQASTDLSPTAGWGVPQNAIRWQEREDRVGVEDMGWIDVTLAATAIGRGFDTVGYAQGAYRNRIVVERLR